MKIEEKNDPSKPYETVLSQTPSPDKYTKIVKGKSITIIVNKKLEESSQPSSTSSSSTTSQTRTESRIRLE